MSNVNTIGTLELDALIASGKAPIFTKVIPLAAGNGALERGQLIGLSDAGAYSAIKSGDTPYGILCEGVTLNADGTVNATVYVTGHFNGNKIIGYEESAHYNALRNNGIYVDMAFAY